MKPSQIKNISSVVAAILMAALCFHNCGSNNGIDFSSTINSSPGNELSTSLTSNASGTGEGFFGKPGEGDYDRKFPNYQCQTSASGQALLMVETATARLTKDNCETTNLPIPFNDVALGFVPYDPDFITYRGSIFEKRIANAPDLNSISEVFCSYRENNEGLDVVIKRDPAGNTRTAKIYYGEAINPALGFAGGWSGKTASATPILLSENNVSGDLRFYSSTVNFELTVNNTLANQLTFPGNLVVTLDQSVISKDVICRVMSTKPVLWIDQAGLITYFKFDDPIYQNNGNYIDSLNRLTGNLLSGDANNKASTGINGGAINTDGVDDKFSIANAGNSLNVGTQMSLAIWVQVTNLVPVTELQSIVQRQDPTNSLLDDYFILAIESLDSAFNPLPQPRLVFYKDAGASCGVTIPWNAPAGYTHMAVTDDGTTLRLYLNGQLSGSSPSSACTYRPVNTRLCIGSAANFGGGNCDGEYLGGNFDEFSYWSRALRQDEISALYGRRSIVP